MKKQNSHLRAVTGNERFVTMPATCFFHNGRTYDLRTIDTATTEALADDPKCMNVQWADASKRPKGQKQPIHVDGAAKAPAKQVPAADEKKK